MTSISQTPHILSTSSTCDFLHVSC